jgi:DNA-binding MarR family transcriptional regulator
MTSAAQADLDDERRAVAGRLHSSAIHLLRAVRVVDGRSGLSPARLSALSVLVFGGPRTIGELASAEGVRSPTMTQLVNGLQADGLVRRRAGTGDGRRVVVEVSPAGARAVREAQRRRLDVLVDLLGPAGEAEIDLVGRAADLLERLVEAHAEAHVEAPSQSPAQSPAGRVRPR